MIGLESRPWDPLPPPDPLRLIAGSIRRGWHHANGDNVAVVAVTLAQWGR